LFDSAKNNPSQHHQQFPPHGQQFPPQQLPPYYYPQQFPPYGQYADPNTRIIVYGFPRHLPSPSFHDSIITSVPLDHLLKGEASKQTVTRCNCNGTNADVDCEIGGDVNDSKLPEILFGTLLNNEEEED
uniref:Uncharacterized protein n=1 Tax=Meloidogyne javanica TaxID=6303 RepID=A0A915N0M4_MELJA